MATYILRDLPQPLWQHFRERAKLHGRPVRALLLDLMTEYAYGAITPRPHDGPPGPGRRWVMERNGYQSRPTR